jgi:hypothetical protein
MAPLPDNLTDRYWVDYEGVTGMHTVMFRFPALTAQGTAITGVQNCISALKAWAHTSTNFNRLRYSSAGSNVSFPVAWTPVAGTSAGTLPANGRPQFVSFNGRSPDGRRVNYTIHGIPAAADVDYRILAAENPTVAACVAALDAPVNGLVTASGQPAIMNAYANFGYNAYFQRKARRTT